MIASLTDEAPASKTKQPAVESISLLRFRPSPTQPRKLFRPEKLKELAESMSKHGFMRHHPILARVNRGTEAPPTLEIVEGERRWRAAKEAGLLEVWCVVEDLTDAQVIEHQLIENLQRDDLTDIEEAEGYQRMLELRDEASGELLYKTREALAERLGRPETTIREQLTLLNLGPAERKEVEGGRLKKQTAYLIARQPTPELREIAAKLIIWPKHEEGPLSYRRAVQEIEKLSKDLRRAPFDRNDASLVPEIFESGKQESRIRIGGGACSDCPMAFVTEARSLCMNPQCYDRKIAVDWERWQARHTDAATDGRESARAGGVRESLQER
jgi:ParB/RepB/Spo0J family partition protein